MDNKTIISVLFRLATESGNLVIQQYISALLFAGEQLQGTTMYMFNLQIHKKRRTTLTPVRFNKVVQLFELHTSINKLTCTAASFAI